MKVLGLDCGIASVGWAVFDTTSQSHGRFEDAGVWTWIPPEEIEDRKRISHKKTQGITLRHTRQIKRRRQRLNDVRRHLAEFELMPTQSKAQFKQFVETSNFKPWKLRIEALDRRLSNAELSAVLYHLAGHRAYSSNAKTKKNDPSQDDRKKLLSALKENEDKFNGALMRGEVRTIGEWIGGQRQRRNRGGDYSHSLKREWIRQECARILAVQRKLGNNLASDNFARRFTVAAFEQRPVTTSEVQKCALETSEPRPDRSPRHAYSFEYFRFLQKLNDLRLVDSDNDTPRRLNPDQVKQVASRFGTKIQMRFADIRKWLSIPDSSKFKGCADPVEEKLDIVAKKKGCCPGYWALKKVLAANDGDLNWSQIANDTVLLDGIATAIAHRDDLEEIETELRKLALDKSLIETLVAEANGGELGFYKGTGRISLVAARKLIPYMENGLDYHGAQIEVYGKRQDRTSNMPEIAGTGLNAVRDWLKTDDIEAKVGSQVASRAIRQIFRQVLALLEERNRPNRPEYRDISVIRLEMARDIGRGAQARDEIAIIQAQQRNKKIDLERSFRDTFEREPSDAELERWILFSEQQGFCAYTFQAIDCRSVLDGRFDVQVDHILPVSQFNIPGLNNKVLCKISENQNKRRNTPYQWIMERGGVEKWDEFCTKARNLFKGSDKKLEYLLATDTEKLRSKLADRYLNDTRWIGRFVLSGLKSLSSPEWPIVVEPVNAGLVAMLRYAWGLDAWKRDPNDPKRRRSDDRHHALDAGIVSIANVGLVQDLTLAYQRAEESGDYFPAKDFRPPWKLFRSDLLTKVYGDRAVIEGPKRFRPKWNEGLFVARADQRRSNGKLHSDNARSLVEEDGDKKQVAYVSIANLKREHLDDLKDADRNWRLKLILDEWFAKGGSPQNPPLWNFAKTGEPPNMKPIRSVPIIQSDPPRFSPRRLQDKHGEAFASFDPEAIVRLDVFENRGGVFDAKYLYVPIYSYQVAADHPPSRMFIGETPYDQWPEIPHLYWFVFSLWPFNLIEVDYRGDIKIGYYRKFHSRDGRLYASQQYQTEAREMETFSPTPINRLQKFTIDRMGRRTLIHREKRTWRGKACI